MSDTYDPAHDDSGQHQPDVMTPNPAGVDTTDGQGDAKQTEADAKLVQRKLEVIRRDKEHFKKSFKRMERSMFMAMQGRDIDWSEKNYKANITGQHVKTKTANLYAKNPKIVSTRKEKLDFLVWDESLDSLKIAMQIMSTGAAILQQAAASGVVAPPSGGPQMPPGQQAPSGGPPPGFTPGAALSPMAGHNGGPPMVDPDEPVPGYSTAVATVQDFQQGMARRQALKKFGKTLELCFADAMAEQTPLDFKSAMKRVVRRSLTTGIAYVELGFQKQFGIPTATTNKLEDFRSRIAHLEGLMADAAEGKFDEYSAETAEIKADLAALEAQPQTILRAGLTFDFLQASKVIPDKMTTALVGFVGSRHLTVEYIKTKAEVEDEFKVKLGDRYTPYTVHGQKSYGTRGVDTGQESTEGVFGATGKDTDLVCLYKHYDKTSGLVYHLVDGHPNHIKPPQAPDVVVPRFWPLYALSFNETESESDPFPKSDVELMADQQNELNRSRQGKREHRDAARPRWAYAAGALDEEEDLPRLMKAKAFDAFEINGMGPDGDINKVLQIIKVPGVDPNLYDTNEVMQDASLTVGAQAAQLGGSSHDTATGAAIANGTTSTTDNSSVDDLDAFFTAIARDGGQILMSNLSKDEVVKIAGPGAVWVEDLGVTPEDIYSEVYLKVEAGSTGKPNQAQEIQNLKEIGPLLLQVGAIPPVWLAREMLRRLDDRIDLTEALVSGIPAIVAQNRMAQPAAGDPANDPNQQGDKGGDKSGPTHGGPSGSSAPMGNNQSAHIV
jgi:hypothetical protein